MPNLTPPYNKRSFVDREKEIRLALGKVRSLLNGDRPHLPHTIFYGPRGSGKSWLLRHLASLLQEEEEFRGRIQVLHLVLMRNGTASPGGAPGWKLEISVGKAGSDPEETVSEILKWALDRLGFSPVPSSDLAQLGTWLVSLVREGLLFVVALVDGLDEALPELLEPLESHYLAVLAKEPNAFLILGSRVPRPQGYTWKMPELRYRIEECELEPFDRHWTEEQLQQLGVDPSIAEEVKKTSGGNPLSNAVLGSQWENKASALQLCAEALLEGVDKALRDYFWALCPLSAFFEEQMPPLLVAYLGGEASAWSIQSCRRILRDMVKTRLVRWHTGKGYVMDPAVRAVLEHALRENDPQRWEKLVQAAGSL